MRIQYLTQYFATPDQPRGSRHYQTALRLVEMGHEVDVITSRPDGAKRFRWDTADVDGIRVHSISTPYASEMSYSRRIAAFAEFATLAGAYARRWRTDVVFASSTPLTIALPAVASKSLRSPMVLEVRDLWPEMPIAMGALTNPAIIRSAQSLEKWAYRNSDRIIALSPGMAEGIVLSGYPRKRISVIPNASDVSDFQNHDYGRLFYQLEPRLRNRAIVLFAGSLGPLYEPWVMVDIAEQFARRDARLALVVVGEGRCRTGAIESARERGLLDESIFFIDPISKRTVVSAFAASRVVLSVAADVRGIGNNSANKFFDGLAAGRPVAVNYGGWQAEVLTTANAGLDLSRDPMISAKQLGDLALNTQRCAEYGSAALRLAKERFERSKLVEKIEGVLTSATRGERLDPQPVSSSRGLPSV